MPRYHVQDKVGFWGVLFWFFLMQSQGSKPALEGSVLSLSGILGFWYPGLPVVDGLVKNCVSSWACTKTYKSIQCSFCVKSFTLVSYF